MSDLQNHLRQWRAEGYAARARDEGWELLAAGNGGGRYAICALDYASEGDDDRVEHRVRGLAAQNSPMHRLAITIVDNPEL
jgi:hypothetical protein